MLLENQSLLCTDLIEEKREEKRVYYERVYYEREESLLCTDLEQLLITFIGFTSEQVPIDGNFSFMLCICLLHMNTLKMFH